MLISARVCLAASLCSSPRFGGSYGILGLCAVFHKPNPCTLSCQVIGIHLNKWRLDWKLGIYVLVLYAIFLCFSIMIEFNVFTFVNLPMCREED